MSGSLTKRHAFITGGARGLGRAIANKFHAEGASITVADLPEVLAQADLPAEWGKVSIDLTAETAERDLVAFSQTLDQLDILVANAGGVPPWRRIADLDMDEWQKVFALNVGGVAMSLKVFAPLLAQSQHASAIQISSINGYRAHPEQALYTATKHAVLGLMRAASMDLGRDGIRVNALAPGPVLTDALRSRIAQREKDGGAMVEDAIKQLESETSLGKLATEEDIAAAALYFAQPASQAVTGICLPIEAGLK